MPYTQCTKTSVVMPGGMPSVVTISRSGIMTAWYGMNMPNRISVNTTSAPGKRQRDSTKPLAAPISEEITATGMASWNVRKNESRSDDHALTQDAVVQCSGRFHWLVTPMSPPDLKLVTISTYSGISTISRNRIARAYLTMEAGPKGRLALRRGASDSTAAGGAATVVM